MPRQFFSIFNTLAPIAASLQLLGVRFPQVMLSFLSFPTRSRLSQHPSNSWEYDFHRSCCLSFHFQHARAYRSIPPTLGSTISTGHVVFPFISNMLAPIAASLQLLGVRFP